MSEWQIIYAIGLGLAIWWGGPDWRISAACVANFLGTMILSASPISVGVLDLATVSALIAIGGWRAHSIAAIFAILVPVYVLGDVLAWPNYTTYAIVDLLGYALLGVLASGDGGFRNKRRNHRRARRDGLSGVADSVTSRNIS